MKVTWKKSSRADGYRIYRRPAAGKWVLVADVAQKSDFIYRYRLECKYEICRIQYDPYKKGR